MQRIRALFLVILFIIFAFTVASQAEASIIPLGPNQLTVNQQIMDLGGGSWQYTYSFVNTESSDIWHFLLYSTFYMYSTNASFLYHHDSSGVIDDIYAAFDPRNIEPDITHWTNMWTSLQPWPPSSGLAIGDSAWLSFIADVYDPDAKLFAYETVDSGYAVTNGGYVQAYGYTGTTGAVPIPGTALLLGSGLFGLAGFIRRFWK